MRAVLSVFALFAAYSVAFAQATELGFYGGVQATANSVVSGSDPGGAGSFSFPAGWRNQSLNPPTQYGLRVTWWQNDRRGWGFDFNSSAVRADAGTLAENGLTELEFSNGVNLLTVNAYRRLNQLGDLRPYVGAGIGVSIPRVEFDSGAGRTSRFQLVGPSFQVVAGASYPLGGNLSVFGEYKGSYTVNNADLDSGGSLNTVIRNGGLNIGVSLGF